jgi:hypothetical protein
MPPAIRERNSVLAIAALAYFSGVHLPRARSKTLALLPSKELIVGTLFTAGCAVPVFARMQAVTNSPSRFGRFCFSSSFLPPSRVSIAARSIAGNPRGKPPSQPELLHSLQLACFSRSVFPSIIRAFPRFP